MVFIPLTCCADLITGLATAAVMGRAAALRAETKVLRWTIGELNGFVRELLRALVAVLEAIVDVVLWRDKVQWGICSTWCL